MTLKFGEFFDNDVPKYLILSHRWGKDEVSFQQMESGDVLDGEGFSKIERFCQIAAQKGCGWAWVDTCCIDKKSSAELSEAINSMYRWYHRSQECLVYLSDVRKGDPDQSIQSSAWFTRGWTVQELLAPRLATFYDREWSRLGTRHELRRDISAAARIDIASLEDSTWSRPNPPWSDRSVACKMSWFAHRQTSRIEDMAYSMLGIFDINMPLIYGEGWKSFKRLQIEIVNSTNDESIFAWDPEPGYKHDEYRREVEFLKLSSCSTSMLAPCPKCFENCGSIKVLKPLDVLYDVLYRPPYVATNKGLQISIRSTDLDLSANKISTLTQCDVFLSRQFVESYFSVLRIDCAAEDDMPIFIVLLRPFRYDIEGPYTDKLGNMVRFKAPPFNLLDSSDTVDIVEKEPDGSLYTTISLKI